jgi:hypothetical protein
LLTILCTKVTSPRDADGADGAERAIRAHLGNVARALHQRLEAHAS